MHLHDRLQSKKACVDHKKQQHCQHLLVDLKPFLFDKCHILINEFKQSCFARRCEFSGVSSGD